MRIEEIVNASVDSDNVSDLNTANGTDYTESDIETILNAYLQSDEFQGKLAVGLGHKQQVYTLISMMYNLLKANPDAVEANKIYAGMQAIASVFVKPYSLLSSDDTTPTAKNFTLVETILGIE